MSKLLADIFSEWGACTDRAVPETGRGREKAVMRHKESSRGRERLARTIEGEVIPRLMLAHRLGQSGQADSAVALRRLGAEDVAELARLVIDHDVSVALSFIKTLKDSGIDVEALYLELLAPAARLLGEMWKADLVDFTDVTVGLSRLQTLLHEFTPAFDEDELPQVVDRRILLVPMPGEQHTFGIMVVEEFFRRAGWECCTAMPQSGAALTASVKKEYFDVVGISVSCEVLLDRVAPCIDAIRKSSKNRGLMVVVGGPLFIERPELVSRVGADGTAGDGREAVLQLRSVFDTNQARIR